MTSVKILKDTLDHSVARPTQKDQLKEIEEMSDSELDVYEQLTLGLRWAGTEPKSPVKLPT